VSTPYTPLYVVGNVDVDNADNVSNAKNDLSKADDYEVCLRSELWVKVFKLDFTLPCFC
jgi:hypothetical protein